MQLISKCQVRCESRVEALEMLAIASETMESGQLDWNHPLVEQYWMIIGEPTIENRLLMYVAVLVPNFLLAACNELK